MMSLDRNMLCTKIWSFFLFSMLFCLKFKLSKKQNINNWQLQRRSQEETLKEGVEISKLFAKKKSFFLQHLKLT
jgi:hypothetical protein